MADDGTGNVTRGELRDTNVDACADRASALRCGEQRTNPFIRGEPDCCVGQSESWARCVQHFVGTTCGILGHHRHSMGGLSSIETAASRGAMGQGALGSIWRTVSLRQGRVFVFSGEPVNFCQPDHSHHAADGSGGRGGVECLHAHTHAGHADHLSSL